MKALLGSALGALVVIALVVACGDAAEVGGAPDAAESRDASAPAIDVSSEGGVIAIDLSPLVLTPAFSASVDDYYVRCAAGDNLVTLTVTDSSGPETIGLDLVEDQAIVVAGQYWIRCLPHDFPPLVVTTHPNAGAPTPGYYLLNTTLFAMVLDVRGTPVWYERGTDVMNVDSPATNTISFVPNTTAPYGSSAATYFYISALDTSTTTTLMAVGTPTDGHELRTLPNGDHLLFTYPIEANYDLDGLETFSGAETIADCKIEELDASGAVVWSWLATDHVDPTQESIEPAVNTINAVSVVDLFHCNAIDVDSSGNLLVSFRHANALFYVERATGRVLWKLGGSPYNKDGATHITVAGDPEVAFNMQHDARFRANGDVTMFDDHGATAGVARGVEYAIDFGSNVATMVWQSLGTAQSAYEGSFRRYDDGHSVIGWGFIASDPRTLTEVDIAGNDVLDIGFGGTDTSYRAVKVPLAELDINVLRTTAAK